MALDNNQLPSDNLSTAFTQSAAPALDNFVANTWNDSNGFKSAQLFDLPGVPSGPYEPQPLQLARLLDTGFSSKDVVDVLKEQVNPENDKRALERNINNIKVVYIDEYARSTNNADFKIDKNGTLIVWENKDLLNKKDLVIEIERPEGYVGAPKEAQQKSLDTLIKSLADHVMNKEGKVEDAQGLVSDKIKKLLHAQPEPEAHFPQTMQHAMQNMQRFAGGGSGQLSSAEADSYFPERQVERLHNESDTQVSLKDAIAGFATSGEREPYYAMRNFGDRGLAVGRYMFTSELLIEWLEDLLTDCGNPPDGNKVLAKLLKSMKNKELAGKCAKAIQSGEFKKFVNDLKTGHLKPGDPATKAAIEKFLPKEMQEAVASQMIDKLAKTGADPSKVAMHMLLGHEPTKEEMAKPEYQRLQDSFERLNAISNVRTQHPHEDISWQDNGGKLTCAPLRGRITDHFGHRDHHPVTGAHADHKGVDLVLNDDKIPALRSGIIEQAGKAGNAGYKITINHGRDHLGRELKTVYMHMQPNLQVHVGDRVSQGQLIGYQGATGRVTGKHLHLGLYMNGQAVDPMKHLKINA
ncbi:MAG: M23 family metallopeptidase [Candidatus Obscuribacterales bacterium]|nr:M23 family metallopeptidase [Candidatus Obscuribacterales bacterium]